MTKKKASVAHAQRGSSTVGLGIAVEGQEGLDWRRWRQLCRLTDSLGFDSLWRSDHLQSVFGFPERECLEAWTSLALAAEWTHSIEFGSLVTPISLRPPAVVARMAASVDVLSNGRLALGLGAGWNQDEHVAFGIPFGDTPTRLAELERGIVEIRRIHREFNPKPVRNPMPIVVGGSGRPVSLGVAARHADEYNVDGLTPDDFAAFSKRLDDSCRVAGRTAESMRRSVTLSVLIAGTRQQLQGKAGELARVFPDYAEMSPDEVLGELGKSPGSWVVGTPEQIRIRLSQYVPAGASRVILTVWLLDDLEDTLKLLANEVAPAMLDRVREPR